MEQPGLAALPGVARHRVFMRRCNASHRAGANGFIASVIQTGTNNHAGVYQH